MELAGQTEVAGQKLRQARDRLNLTVRQVEDASKRLAERYGNDDFVLSLARISEIETRGAIPTIYKLYSLCAIYRLNYLEVLSWYGVQPALLPSDWTITEAPVTHPADTTPSSYGEITAPLALDPGIDLTATTYLSRMIQRWGPVAITALNGLQPKNRRYAFIGADDWFMYPLLAPGSLIEIDEKRTDIRREAWRNEYERPMYFVEHPGGYSCSWCSIEQDRLILVPHPISGLEPRVFPRSVVRIVGQVSGIAMRFDEGDRRRTPSSAA